MKLSLTRNMAKFNKKTFAKLSLASFDQFDTFLSGGGGGWGKSRLKTISVPVGVDIETKLGYKPQTQLYSGSN